MVDGRSVVTGHVGWRITNSWSTSIINGTHKYRRAEEKKKQNKSRHKGHTNKVNRSLFHDSREGWRGANDGN
jgi:hypothetical protein